MFIGKKFIFFFDNLPKGSFSRTKFSLLSSKKSKNFLLKTKKPPLIHPLSSFDFSLNEEIRLFLRDKCPNLEEGLTVVTVAIPLFLT